jgi:hypothetical protein
VEAKEVGQTDCTVKYVVISLIHSNHIKLGDEVTSTSNWEELFDEDNTPYYYNKATGTIDT